MLTRREQEILDNAPEWAEYYMTHSDFDTGYAVQFKGGFFDCKNKRRGNPMGSEYCDSWDFHQLSDLRKKQGKTVVDLFDGHKYDFYVDDNPHIGIYKILRNAFFSADTGNKICGAGQATNIKLKPEPLAPDAPITPVKQGKKAEYVPMTTSNHYEIFKAMHDDGDVYVRCEDGEYEGMQGCIINLADAIHDEVTIYRKVETEIKTEKRWLMYEESSDTFTPCREDQGAVVGFQIIEITVEV